MCVLAMAWAAHPRWRLILAGNRDERHERPAISLRRWPEASHLLAGRDLQSNGAWLGVSEQGRFGVVTNLRGYGAPLPGAPSRGLLLGGMLLGKGPYANPNLRDLPVFSPFNLIRIQDDAAEFWTNRPEPAHRLLPPGIYGLSNGGLDEPWPRTLRLKAILSDWLTGGAARPHALLEGLEEGRRAGAAAASDGPPDPPNTPIFIRRPDYGTRCATVVAIDQKGKGLIVERRFDAQSDSTGETTLEFAWPA